MMTVLSNIGVPFIPRGQELGALAPELVLISLGGNDMLRKVDEAQTKANLRTLIKTLQSQGIAVVLERI